MTPPASSPSMEEAESRIMGGNRISTDSNRISTSKLPAGWLEMSEFPPKTKFGPLIEYPQFFTVNEATCIVYEHDEGEAIGLVRARIDQDEAQWEPYAWLPLPRWAVS